MATLTAQTALDMTASVFWSGTVQDITATSFSLVSGTATGLVTGTFALGQGGEVTGQVDSFSYSIASLPQFDITGIGRDVARLFTLAQSAQPERVVDAILRGDDVLNGSASADHLRGARGMDSLFGNDGTDKLLGQSGDDLVSGGSGADTLVGGLGADTLTGGTGQDVFSFRTFAQAASADHITDFEVGTDRILLRAIDADTTQTGNQIFAFIGAQAFDGAAGELRYEAGVVSGDTDGDGTADFTITLDNAPASLTAADFYL